MANDTLLFNRYVFVYGQTSGTTINRNGLEQVYSGGVATGTVINISNGAQGIGNGGLAVNTVMNGGYQRVEDGGVAQGTTVHSGYQQVSSGGHAVSAVISGGVQQVNGGGSATDTSVYGGRQQVSSGGSVTDTTVYNGGFQDLSGGSAATTVLNGGQQNVLYGGRATDTTLNSGAIQMVSGAGSVADLNTINSGTQYVSGGGVVTDTTVSNGAQYIRSGGSSVDTVVNTGGAQYISAGGIARNTSAYAGTVEFAGGTIGGNTLISGGTSVTGSAIANEGVLTVDQNYSSTLSASIAGTGSFVKEGTNAVILTGMNSYSGGTQVTAGTLQGNTNSLQGDIVNNATLVFDQGVDGIYSGSLSGTGTLVKQGSGDLTLAASAVVGQVNHNAGTLNIGPNQTLSITNGMTMASGTTLGVDISSTPSVEVAAGGLVLAGNNTINITGYSPVTDTGTYTLVTTASGVTGGFTTTVAGSSLHTYVDLDTYLVGSAWLDSTGKNILARLELVWNNNDPGSAHGTFNIPTGESFDIGVALADNTLSSALGFGWSGQDLTKTGAGTLILNNVNTYTGHTDVQNGTLIVGSTAAHNNAQIAGNLDVQNGAYLGGHGHINGTVTINSGGTLAPGNSVGTLTVSDAIFNSGSTFQIEANPDGTADRLVADSSLGGAGTVTINTGATLDIVAGAGTWSPSTSYLIIDTDGGVTGQFSTVTSNLAFLNETVNYATPNQVWLTLTRNDIGMGDLDGTYNENNTGKGIDSLGVGDPVYDTIVGMSRDQALYAYNNLSGEIHGSVKSAILTNRYARDAVNQHLSNESALRASQLEVRKSLWVSAWGHDGHLKNDGNAAKLDQQGWGFLLGADAYNDGTTAAGVAFGYEQTDIKTRSNRNSDADINAVHLLAYGRTNLGPIDLKGGIGYSWLDIDTTRHVNVGAIQSKNQADYDGGLIQAYIEGSHTVELNEQTSVTPYVNLAYQWVKTDSFTEKGEQAQLHNSSSSDHLITTTAGVRGLWDVSSKASLYGELGWQYNMGDIAPHAHLNFAGGSTYTVKGTEVDRNSAIIGLGGNYQIKPNIRLSAGYEGQFGNQSRDHALKLRFEYKF